MSRTWLTYGAPDLEKQDFSGAYSVSVVNDFLVNISSKSSLGAYIIYTQSKGGAKTDGLAKTYFGREVYNRKEDFTVGMRHVNYITDMFHLMEEVHYSQRQDGREPVYSMWKFSLAPTLVPIRKKDFFARPHFRFIISLARYNDAAMDNLYSPYLEFVGHERWGLFMGVKAEWWLW
jgi:maltoporin